MKIKEEIGNALNDYLCDIQYLKQIEDEVFMDKEAHKWYCVQEEKIKNILKNLKNML